MSIEKVNPNHPDKVADRIANAIVDLAYGKNENPKVAVEVLLGHGDVNVIIESSETFTDDELNGVVERILGGKPSKVNFVTVPQDTHLADNQNDGIRCGDNGIFKGVPLTEEEKELSRVAREIYAKFPYDGKYVLSDGKLIVCQSNADENELNTLVREELGYKDAVINPLGSWTGGYNVDSGATNRKLGSDMAQSVTGGGLCGKDFSKADLSANIYAFALAQQKNKTVEMHCAIGDTVMHGKVGNKAFSVPYSEVVEFAKEYIKSLGGFEAFSEWGLF